LSELNSITFGFFAFPARKGRLEAELQPPEKARLKAELQTPPEGLTTQQ